jgi:23S rRNA (uracil-5-)-methyltransferase RumA
MHCPNKELCGSCGWSHIPYDKQLTQKLADINGSFALKELDLKCEEILPSPVTEHFRNRMDFVIDFEGRVGLRQKGKWWRVIDDHSCFLASEDIERLFHVVRDWTKTSELTFFDRKAHVGLLRYAVIRSTLKGETMITIVTSAPKDAAEEAATQTALETLASNSGATTVIWSINHTISDVSVGDELRIISGNGVIHEEINGVQFAISPNAFFQTNPHGASVLQQTVLERVAAVAPKTLLDLYCGSGFFGISSAMKLPDTKVIGVEIVPEAIEDAKRNATLNGIGADRIELTAQKTEDFDWGGYNADCVILDPPRSGMHDSALADVLRILPPEIIYVSCNPKNFAREMVQLKEHYTVSFMRAIDMFPHTPHVELVTHLTRK